MNIKISSLHSILHDSESFNKRSQEFIESIETLLHTKLISSALDDYNCDLKLIFIESGGSEMLFKENMDKLQEPYYFLTSGDNNSLAATLEILTYLNTIGKRGEIIHGSNEYIVKRIAELSSPKNNILKGKRYGVIGKPSDWLISSIPSYEKVAKRLGATLVDIPLEELINGYQSFKENIEVENKNFDKGEVRKAEVVFRVLQTIIKKYSLDGFTIRCFDLLSTIKTTGCLALAKFNQEGIIATCEGDIMAMLSMAIAKEVSSSSSFQANPSRIDVEKNTILFAHCTVPLNMLSSYKFMTHFESEIGVAIKGELIPQEVTILRLSKDINHYFLSKGTIVKNFDYPNLCRTQILVRLEENVKELLTNPCGNHHIIFYGDYVKQLKELLK